MLAKNHHCKGRNQSDHFHHYKCTAHSMSFARYQVRLFIFQTCRFLLAITRTLATSMYKYTEKNTKKFTEKKYRKNFSVFFSVNFSVFFSIFKYEAHAAY